MKKEQTQLQKYSRIANWKLYQIKAMKSALRSCVIPTGNYFVSHKSARIVELLTDLEGEVKKQYDYQKKFELKKKEREKQRELQTNYGK